MAADDKAARNPKTTTGRPIPVEEEKDEISSSVIRAHDKVELALPQNQFQILAENCSLKKTSINYISYFRFSNQEAIQCQRSQTFCRLQQIQAGSALEFSHLLIFNINTPHLEYPRLKSVTPPKQPADY